MFFDLPKGTHVKRVVPKNSFNTFSNNNEKKLFVEIIERIKWNNKISSDTVNLPCGDVNEIQVFEIELRTKEKINTLLELIDKSIPYHIIYVLRFDDEVLISATKKHPNPKNENQCVIDWTFQSSWFHIKSNSFRINLKGTLDDVFNDICFQISGKEKKSITELINDEKKIKRLKNQALKLQSLIKRSKQFNDKVRLNLELQEINRKLSQY